MNAGGEREGRKIDDWSESRLKRHLKLIGEMLLKMIEVENSIVRIGSGTKRDQSSHHFPDLMAAVLCPTWLTLESPSQLRHTVRRFENKSHSQLQYCVPPGSL
ncbi:Uncharacterized protein Fot_50117 [Forsythia ovata]|uniref:Uncharacterized protein n=1 Tax=Forsythia ovata TaxID=205694 RepID=A0ABD1PX89_9LAMI